MDERRYNTPIFKDEQTETPHFRCGWCGEDTTDELAIRFDHTINGNVCLSCLEDEDHQYMLGMDVHQFRNYKSKVLKSNPIEL